ncbi:MAG: adenylosuccinate synthase [Candidatus Saccharimonadales bacterium]|nr:adenylosuccinate synthase [Candidatus Saccharibacteria bacterium]
MKIIGVFGQQRGDEGKGRVVDMLAEECDIVARFNGGSNAGHTVVLPDGRELALHIVPSGIAHPKAVNVIGNGTIVDPVRFADELRDIEKLGIHVTPQNLKVSASAHLVLPHYKLLEEIRELGRGAQGSTKAGIADTYAAKAQRAGVRAERLLGSHESLLQVVREGLESVGTARKEHGLASVDIENEVKSYALALQKLQPFVTDTSVYVNERLAGGATLLAEGAQAFLLDIDHGMYPYVTSSSTTAGGVAPGLGIAPTTLERSIGIVKAVQSHVGGGPFVTEIHDEKLLGVLHGDMSTIDAEKGTTTGRIRRLGYLDITGIRRANMVNGTTELAITKLDWVPRYGSIIKVCTSYTYRGETLTMAPDSAWALEKCEPVYEELSAWDEDITEVRSFADLPQAAQDYISALETWTGLPVTYIGVGPRRDQVINR